MIVKEIPKEKAEELNALAIAYNQAVVESDKATAAKVASAADLAKAISNVRKDLFGKAKEEEVEFNAELTYAVCDFRFKG